MTAGSTRNLCAPRADVGYVLMTRERAHSIAAYAVQVLNRLKGKSVILYYYYFFIFFPFSS